MKRGNYVHIVKVGENSPNENGISVSYWAEGELLSDIVVGSPISLFRERNKPNAHGKLGHFYTSSVKKIDGNLVYTQNSTYKIEVI